MNKHYVCVCVRTHAVKVESVAKAHTPTRLLSVLALINMSSGKRCLISKFCGVLIVLAMVSVVTIVTLWTIALTGGEGDDGVDITAPWDR